MLEVNRAIAARCISVVLLTLPVLGLCTESEMLSETAMPTTGISSVNVQKNISHTDASLQQEGSAPVSAPKLTTESIQQLRPVDVAEAGRPLTIALLMPQDGSPFMAAAKIVGNGLMAASKTSARPANILLIEAPSTATLDDQLDAAVAAGADVVVGPLERNAVENIAARESLPLPTVALNIPSQAQSAPVPDNLIMMSVSTETEAKYIARLAVKALPAYSDRYGFPQIAIFVSQGAWEQRIAETFQQELAAAHVNYNVITISEETLPTLQKSIEPKLTEEEELVYREKTAEARKHYAAGSTQLKRRIAAIQAERRAKIATTEPPYQASLLALDAQTASLVRNRLPREMRVWATSASNPGDPRTSSTSAALAYDLENVVFSECPLIVRYDAQGFEARFETAMPYSLAAKRLFALGADAYELAQQWSIKRQIIQFHGETGFLQLDRKQSAEVTRTPQTIIVREGHLIEVAPDLISTPELPNIQPPKPIAETNTPLVQVDEIFNDVRRTDVKSIIISPQQTIPDPVPTPMLPPVKRPLSSDTSTPLAPNYATEATPILRDDESFKAMPGTMPANNGSTANSDETLSSLDLESDSNRDSELQDVEQAH